MSQEMLHVFKYAQCQHFFYGRKVVEEFRERSAVLQIIEECPNRHTGTHKDGGSPENVGIRMNAGKLTLHRSTSYLLRMEGSEYTSVVR